MNGEHCAAPRLAEKELQRKGLEDALNVERSSGASRETNMQVQSPPCWMPGRGLPSLHLYSHFYCFSFSSRFKVVFIFMVQPAIFMVQPVIAVTTSPSYTTTINTIVQKSQNHNE